MPPTRARNTYLANAITSAPPERLLTMLYDALVNNIVVAEEAMERREYFTLNEHLVRAQNIVLELQATLKPDLWSGGPSLMAIYGYVYKLLVRGNTKKDANALSDARKLLEPLQDAWHTAANQVLAERATAQAGGLAASA